MNIAINKIDEKIRVAFSSVVAAVFLTAFKLVVGISTGSLGIISEAAHSGLDLIAAVITFFAVKLAAKPPDKNHNYGHGKIENFSAFIETILLLITCIWIIYEAIERLFYKSVLIEVNFWSYLVVIVAIVIDYKRSKALLKVAKEHNSQALEADGLHFKTDIWSSSVVLLGLIFAQFNYHFADSIAGLIVALIVIYVSLKLGKRTVDALLDRVPDGLREKIKLKILKFTEVESIKDLRIRQSGPKFFVDLTLSFKRTLPFENVHNLLDKIESEIKEIDKNIDVIIHPEPYESDEETLFDKISLITSKYGVSVHEYERNKMADATYCIDLHIESNPDLSLSEAHQISSKIEAEILALNDNLSKVNIHIEEKHNQTDVFSDVTKESSDLINDLKTLTLEEKNIKECSNFSVFKSNDKLKVLMDCKVSGDLKVIEVHSLLTKLEQKIKNKFSFIDKVNIHSEPIENDK
ncbi:MAG TPA: cation diffusion facilitator family transporter [Ignavibacteria bacterium]